MTTLLAKTVVAALLTISTSACGQDHKHADHASPYAGFQDRKIKSLSNKDIEELRRGGGWGLALPAELNGLPGPLHLLELRSELNLSEEQAKSINLMYQEMRKNAVAAGERFIAAEAKLSQAFENSRIGEEELRSLLSEAALARAELRFVHLSRHLATPELLSQEQIRKYNVLRGYSDDPCESVPEGHDPNMWRRHNGCDQ